MKPEKNFKKSNAKIHGTFFQLINLQVLLIYVEWSDRGDDGHCAKTFVPVLQFVQISPMLVMR